MTLVQNRQAGDKCVWRCEASISWGQASAGSSKTIFAKSTFFSEEERMQLTGSSVLRRNPATSKKIPVSSLRALLAMKRCRNLGNNGKEYATSSAAPGQKRGQRASFQKVLSQKAKSMRMNS